MPRFLVRIEVDLPPSMAEPERVELLARELERGLDLKAGGAIEGIWRLPGRLANVGIWRADNATELDRALRSLPVWEWTTIAVEPIGDHPLTDGPESLE